MFLAAVGRAGDPQPHSAPAQADTGGLINPSSCQAKGGWGHLRGCLHPLSPHGTTSSSGADRHGGAGATPTAAAPCPGRHSMTQLDDPVTPSSRHRDVPATPKPLLGSDRTPVPPSTPRKQQSRKWVVTQTQEKLPPPSSFHINKS